MITVNNNGRGDIDSFEIIYYSSWGEFYGYGETEEEAKESLKESVFEAIQELQNINFDDVDYVDGLGKPLVKK